MFVRIIPVDLHELLKYRRLATCTLDSKPRTIMEMAKNVPIMFVITILRPENSWADRAGKVLHMKLSTQRGDVGASQSPTAFGTDKVESSKVVRFAEGKETSSAGGVYHVVGSGEEFGCNDFVAVVTAEAVEMIDTAQSADKLASHDFAAGLTGLVAPSAGARAGAGSGVGGGG